MSWKAANWGIPGFETAGETVKKPALHVAITKYLEQIAALKKPNTHRKYEAVLNRFGEFFRDCSSIDAISGDDLTLCRNTQERPWPGIQHDPAQRGHRRAVSQASWEERDHARVVATGAHHATHEFTGFVEITPSAETLA